MEMIFVKPLDGMRVRDPMADNAVIPPGGKRVTRNGYWTRRILDGDVEEVERLVVEEVTEEVTEEATEEVTEEVVEKAKPSTRRRVSSAKDKPEE